jgi:hypothetical protein
VNTSSTPKVQYAYVDLSGGANNSRLTSMTYPNGRVLNYNYGSGLDSSISRLTSLSDSSATMEQYAYLGLDTVVQRSHPQTGVNLTYIQQSGDTHANTDGGDKYTGLDRFGRVIDQFWVNPSTATTTDRFQYGYDRDSNALYRAKLVNSAFGELYHPSGAGNGYDGLNQLTAFSRGVLTASSPGGTPDTVLVPTHSQSWTLDALGSCEAFGVSSVSGLAEHLRGARSRVSDTNGTAAWGVRICGGCAPCCGERSPGPVHRSVRTVCASSACCFCNCRRERMG